MSSETHQDQPNHSSANHNRSTMENPYLTVEEFDEFIASPNRRVRRVHHFISYLCTPGQGTCRFNTVGILPEPSPDVEITPPTTSRFGGGVQSPIVRYLTVPCPGCRSDRIQAGKTTEEDEFWIMSNMAFYATAMQESAMVFWDTMFAAPPR